MQMEGRPSPVCDGPLGLKDHASRVTALTHEKCMNRLTSYIDDASPGSVVLKKPVGIVFGNLFFLSCLDDHAMHELI